VPGQAADVAFATDAYSKKSATANRSNTRLPLTATIRARAPR
jgi:hypothetical protein